MLKGSSIQDWLIKRTSLKHSLFGNDKAPQIMNGQKKHYKNIFFEFNRWTIYMPASEVASFPKVADIINL